MRGELCGAVGVFYRGLEFCGRKVVRKQIEILKYFECTKKNLVRILRFSREIRPSQYILLFASFYLFFTIDIIFSPSKEPISLLPFHQSPLWLIEFLYRPKLHQHHHPSLIAQPNSMPAFDSVWEGNLALSHQPGPQDQHMKEAQTICKLINKSNARILCATRTKIIVNQRDDEFFLGLNEYRATLDNVKRLFYDFVFISIKMNYLQLSDKRLPHFSASFLIYSTRKRMNEWMNEFETSSTKECLFHVPFRPAELQTGGECIML